MRQLIRSSLLSGAVVVLLFAGCSTPPESPSDAVQEVYSAIRQGDADTIWQRMSAADRTRFMSAVGVTDEKEAKLVIREGTVEQANIRVTIGETQIDGDLATVVITGYRNPEDTVGTTLTMKLIKEDGKWVANGND